MCGGGQVREQGNGHEGCGRVHAGKEAGETLAWGGGGGEGGLGSDKICGHEGCGIVHPGKEAGETLAWGRGEGGLEVTRFVGMKAVEDFMLKRSV